MSSIDQRIVEMKFDNAQFERGIKTTLGSLEALNKGLKLDGATKGLNDIGTASKNLSLAHIGESVDNISNRFKAMSVIAITALSTIAHQAVIAGGQLLKSLSVKPINEGLKEYETNLNSIQTILSNTSAKGTTLDQVNEALQQLNLYSDKTIYNFSQMARNIGTFTAAGVDLNTSVNAIKGIANLAAVSGSSADQASTAMYQLSQALATGTVKLMDWNSVVNAGMGGAVFQEAIKETARVHGVAVDSIIEEQGSFRDSLQKGWLTSEILTETLSKFTGDLTEAQLKTMGYNDEQIVGILKMGQTAQDAATKVKTMSQLIGTLQEAAGSGWAQTWQLIFGDFEEAKTLFTGASDVLGGFITASANARNKVLGDWKALGGRTVIIEAISSAFNALLSVLKPIKDAFQQIFPPTTGQQLYNLSVIIRDFAAGLKIGEDAADKLRRTFAGVFAILGIGWEVVKQVAGVLARLFGVATEGSGQILDTTASIGDFLVKLHETVKNGKGFTQFFEKLGDVLEAPIRGLRFLAGLIGDFFASLSDVDLSGLDRVKVRFEPLGNLGDAIFAVWSKIVTILKAAWNAFEPLADMFADFFGGLGQAISEAFGGIDFNTVLDTINTGLLAGLVLLLRKFLKDGFKFDVGGGFLGNIGSSFEALTGTLTAMQTQLKANTLLRIAGAIALLTASVVALSLIDSGKLTVALTAMAAMFTQLMVSMAIFEKIAVSKGFIKMPLVTAAMIALAIAIDLLTIAVTALSKLDWNGLAKGLTGVTVLIGALAGAMKVMPTQARMVSTGIGLILLAAAIKILASAVEDLSGLSWTEMAKGLVGVGALLGSLAIFTKLAAVNKGGVAQGAGIILLAVGIKILASALEDFAAFSWDEIARGLVSMAGGLVIMAAALNVIPPSSILSAAAILIVAASLGMIADALKDMSDMSWEQIAKGVVALAGALVLISVALALLPPSSLFSAAAIFIVAASLGMIADALGTMGGMTWGEIAKGLVMLAGSLAIIAAAMYLMTGALPGALALIVVAGALALIAPVLTAFGDMSWEEIAKGLTMLAGVFVVLAAAGILLTPVVPTLIGLGIAVALLGVGMLAAGIGLLAFSVGLTALSVAGAAATAAVVGIVAGLIGLIPTLMEQIGLGIIAFALVIAQAGPQITLAITTVLNALIDAIAELTPKIVSTLLLLLALMLEALVKAVPMMVDAGLRLLTGILNGIAKNIGKVVKAATDIIVNFLNALGDSYPRIIQAGVDLILKFVNGLADGIRRNSTAMGEAGGNLASAIIEGMARGLTAGIGTIARKAKDVAKAALNAAKDFLGINSPSKEFFDVGKFSDEGMADGMDAFSGVVSKSAESVGKDAIHSLRKSISGMSDLISGDIDITPRITPVLDLTGVKKEATKLGSMLIAPISVEAGYAKAKDASNGYTKNQEAAAEQEVVTEHNEFKFVQNNTSPKALSEAEIYRQTKNQLSVAKGALK